MPTIVFFSRTYLFDIPGRYPVHWASTDLEVLLLLYRLTDGERWKRSDNWFTNREPSDWHGVEVNEEGRVVKLSLSSNNLQGILGLCALQSACFALFATYPSGSSIESGPFSDPLSTFQVSRSRTVFVVECFVPVLCSREYPLYVR